MVTHFDTSFYQEMKPFADYFQICDLVFLKCCNVIQSDNNFIALFELQNK